MDLLSGQGKQTGGGRRVERTRGGKEGGHSRMGLKAIDNVSISVQPLLQLARRLVPDVDVAAIRAAHHPLVRKAHE